MLGIGFVLEPSEAHALIQKDIRNKQVLFPYLNGEDLNSRADQSPSRWVINFFDWSDEKARGYPDCFRIVEEKVKPERMKVNRKVRRENWWMFAERAAGLYNAIAPLERVISISIVSKHIGFVVSATMQVYSHRTAVFPFDSLGHFALLQANIHESWAWKYSSTLEARINYSPSDCFETFPFPPCLRDGSTADTFALESIGREYYEHRQALMLDMQLGLTKTYNLFHDPGILPGVMDHSALELRLKKSGASIGPAEAVVRIQVLRDLHVKMDAAVLAAYAWTDIVLGHDFHVVDFLPENDRVRFTLSPQARREVLKRLLELNHRYHAEEEAAEEQKPKKIPKRKRAGHGPGLGL